MESRLRTTDEIANDHAYHQPKCEETARRHERVRNLTVQCAISLRNTCPPSRQLDIALMKMEEARMWANAAIACNEGGS